jgi:hypothetical protein
MTEGLAEAVDRLRPRVTRTRSVPTGKPGRRIRKPASFARTEPRTPLIVTLKDDPQDANLEELR